MAIEGGISYLNAGYKREKWKWVLALPNRDDLLKNPFTIKDKLSHANVMSAYELDKLPKILPCRKKCNANPWCLAGVFAESKSKRICLTQQTRDMKLPIGLQNTANTCWINSALQSLFHLKRFRSCINSIEGFKGEESLSSYIYLLQAVFVEMDLHRYKALACIPGSVFEKVAVYATKKIMQEDQDFEVLKCVSEFLENTIDNLLGDPITEPVFSPLFKTSLCHIARWKCTSCQKTHVCDLAPSTSYTMAAYVCSDECPLEQCILDLQAETQTGVWVVCGKSEDGSNEGCGMRVQVDRVVTPRILSLPHYLIIRNNSLVDIESKRRLHVVYPETLDLSQNTSDSQSAQYSLRAVIYHHGHWIKHFSAHVKLENGKWYNLNDEKVSPLVTQSGVGLPAEVHKNYFSLGNIAAKYKQNSKVRISRRSFIWIYERKISEEKIHFEPLQCVIDYVCGIQWENKFQDEKLQQQRKDERKELLESLAVCDRNDDIRIISQSVLSSWITSSHIKFIPQPSLLAQGMCQHRRFNPFKSNSIKCILKNKAETLVNCDSGIHSDVKDVPVLYDLHEALCYECLGKHVHHILFRDHLKKTHVDTKKEASKHYESDRVFVGVKSINCWPLLALNSYMKKTGLSDLNDEDPENASSEEGEKVVGEGEGKELKLDEECNGSEVEEKRTDIDAKKEEESSQLSLFNEEVICPHSKLDPKVSGFWVPRERVEQIKLLCSDSLHPAACAPDFDCCTKCEEFLTETTELCIKGKLERKQLYQLFLERKRPNPFRDVGKAAYLLSRQFLSIWRPYIRSSEKDSLNPERPEGIDNSQLLCRHRKLLYNTSPDGPLMGFACLVNEDEWTKLSGFYPVQEMIEVSFPESGQLVPKIGICKEGCVESEEYRLYEEQFNFESGSINVRQVNSVKDVPSLQNGVEKNVTEEESEKEPACRKRRKTYKEEESKVKSPSRTTVQTRLVRASKIFSCDDTIKEIQYFIAEKTGIWPLLQTLWLPGGVEHGPNPLLLTDEHRTRTLRSLRIRENDTIYFKAALEDLEKAAGDGVTEYNELEGD